MQKSFKRLGMSFGRFIRRVYVVQFTPERYTYIGRVPWKKFTIKCRLLKITTENPSLS